jgi:hypothetical protein
MEKQIKEANYTAAQEARITAAAQNGPLNLETAKALAAEFGGGKSYRSVVAKIGRMGLPYAKKVAVSKTGEPVERKENIVAEIARYVPGSLDGLEKASKPALANIRDAFAAFADD